MKSFEKGFTLVEILTYTAVLLIIISSFIPFFLWVMRAYHEGERTKEVLDNAQRAMETISYKIRESESVYTPTSSENQLSLRKRDYHNESVFIDFYLCDKSICLKRESQDPVPLTSDIVEVTDLRFIKMGSPPNSVKVEINLENYSKEYFITSTTSLRKF